MDRTVQSFIGISQPLFVDSCMTVSHCWRPPDAFCISQSVIVDPCRTVGHSWRPPELLFDSVVSLFIDSLQSARQFEMLVGHTWRPPDLFRFCSEKEFIPYSLVESRSSELIRIPCCSNPSDSLSQGLRIVDSSSGEPRSSELTRVLRRSHLSGRWSHGFTESLIDKDIDFSNHNTFLLRRLQEIEHDFKDAGLGSKG